MKFENRHVYHVYNQGNNKQPIFLTHADYVDFLKFTKAYILPQAEMLAWCLLPNHFHFMIVANEQSTKPHQQGNLIIDALTNSFRKLTSSYAHQFNKKYNRSGSVFRAKTKSKDLTVQCNHHPASNYDYYLNCFYYIHQNPLRHQLVTDLQHWKYSSYLFYAGARERDMCARQLATEICDYNPAVFTETANTRLPDEFLVFIEQ